MTWRSSRAFHLQQIHCPGLRGLRNSLGRLHQNQDTRTVLKFIPNLTLPSAPNLLTKLPTSKKLYHPCFEFAANPQNVPKAPTVPTTVRCERATIYPSTHPSVGDRYLPSPISHLFSLLHSSPANDRRTAYASRIMALK